LELERFCETDEVIREQLNRRERFRALKQQSEADVLKSAQELEVVKKAPLREKYTG
jgi:hypothetical protein